MLCGDGAYGYEVTRGGWVRVRVSDGGQFGENANKHSNKKH